MGLDVLTTSAAVLLGALLVAAVAALVLRERRRAARELARSQAELAALGARIDGLSAEVRSARQAVDARPPVVITSLGDPTQGPSRVRLEEAPFDRGPAGVRPPATELGSAVQNQLVAALARQRERAAGRPVVAVAVRAMALGHGVRRALAEENRDRIAIAMRLEMRRSRRARREEERAARRIVREHRRRASAAGRAAARQGHVQTRPQAREGAA